MTCYTIDGRLLSEGGRWRSWDDVTIEAKESGVCEVRSVAAKSVDNAGYNDEFTLIYGDKTYDSVLVKYFGEIG